MNKEKTTMRLSKDLMNQINKEKRKLQRYDDLIPASAEDFIQYLMVKHKLYDGDKVGTIPSGMSHYVASKLLEVDKDIPSHYELRAIIYDILGYVEQVMKGDEQKKIQSELDTIFEKYNTHQNLFTINGLQLCPPVDDDDMENQDALALEEGKEALNKLTKEEYDEFVKMVNAHTFKSLDVLDDIEVKENVK